MSILEIFEWWGQSLCVIFKIPCYSEIQCFYKLILFPNFSTFAYHLKEFGKFYLLTEKKWCHHDPQEKHYNTLHKSYSNIWRNIYRANGETLVENLEKLIILSNNKSYYHLKETIRLSNILNSNVQMLSCLESRIDLKKWLWATSSFFMATAYCILCEEWNQLLIFLNTKSTSDYWRYGL